MRFLISGSVLVRGFSMSQQLIAHVFSAVLTLERCLEEMKTAVSVRPDLSYLALQLSQQAKVVRQMRQVANRMQLEVASSNQLATGRSIAIFYALNQMVRPEIMKTYSEIHHIEGLNGRTFEASNDNHSTLH